MANFNPIEIAEAWIAKLTSKPESERALLAKERLRICELCDHKKYKELTNENGYYYCGKCGCPLAGKSFSRAENACPLKLWTCDIDFYNRKRDAAKAKKKLL